MLFRSTPRSSDLSSKLQAEPPVAEEKAAAGPPGPAPEAERFKPEPASGPALAERLPVEEQPAVQPEPAVRKAAERAESEALAGKEAPQAASEPAVIQEAAAAAEAAEVQAAAPGEKPAPAPEDEAISEASPKSMFRRVFISLATMFLVCATSSLAGYVLATKSYDSARFAAGGALISRFSVLTQKGGNNEKGFYSSVLYHYSVRFPASISGTGGCL